MNKQCTSCKIFLLFERFSKHSSTADGLDKKCKSCVAKARKNPNRKKMPRTLDIDKTDMSSTDWQGGKYAGTIFKRTNGVAWIACCGRGKNSKQKSFHPKNYNSDGDAFNAADKWRKTLSDKLRLTKNKYKIIEHMNTKYLIIKLTYNYVTLCDFDQLDAIKNITLCSRCGGDCEQTNYCGYWDQKIQKMQSFHRYVCTVPGQVVDHINGYPLDNRKCNLRSTSYSVNNQNRTKISTVNTEFLDDDKVKVTIQVIIPGKTEKKIITRVLSSKQHVNRYLTLITQKIDKIRNTKEIQKLKQEYEDIMTKHANEFKWRDLIVEENSNKDTIAQEREERDRINHQQNRINTYLKFKQIWDQFELTNEQVKQYSNDRRIHHINFDENTYKYCHTCSTWKNLNKYRHDINKWDNASTVCNECANKTQKIYKQNNSDVIRSWKERNKEHVTAYNKTYQEQYRSNHKTDLSEYFKERYRKQRAAQGKTVLSNTDRKAKFFQKFVDKVTEQQGTCLGNNLDYQTAHSKIKVKCKINHEFEITWNNLSRNKWCAICARKRPKR